MISFCSENRSPLTDSERANIRLNNLQVNERHQFIPVPVPESDTFTSFIEDQLAKIDNLSECDLNAMVKHTLDTESNSTNTDLQPVQSLTSVSERDLALEKEAKPSGLIRLAIELSGLQHWYRKRSSDSGIHITRSVDHHERVPEILVLALHRSVRGIGIL